MADLTAQGLKPEERWRQRLPAAEVVLLGRACGAWSVPWERWMSHRHAELQWRQDVLQVRQLPEARNPIFFRGKETPSFEIKPGESFVIGSTVFSLGEEPKPGTPEARDLVQSRTISAAELKQVPFRDAPHRLDVLSRLPEVIISAANEQDLCLRLSNLLLAGIPRADVVCLVSMDEHAALRILHQEMRRSLRKEFYPSLRLIKEALHNFHQSVLHVWSVEQRQDAPQFTQDINVDWAFCTPVEGEASGNWGIYVTGRFVGDLKSTLMGPLEMNDLGDDLKFTELVASILGSLLQVQSLQHKQTILSSFFSPGVVQVLTQGDPTSELKPRQVEVTVLFCDLRGFSGKVEQSAADLFAVLERVSEALGVMTGSILERDGVIADFQGDSAMAYWGWPIVLTDKVQRACLAALSIGNTFRSFARKPDHPLAGFQAGIGIATGDAVAGRIGPRDQSKVSVFGPVVNLSSRLQDMTKIFRVPILMDEKTAHLLQATTPPSLARCRRLAQVKPYGLNTPLMVYELLPPASDYPDLIDAHIATYQGALDAFIQGDWATAWKLLHQVPPEDQGKDFITGFILQNHHTPPPDWNGVIELTRK
jgi:adenylate cyclase